MLLLLLLLVWKGVLRIQDLPNIQCGIRGKANFLDGIRDLTDTRRKLGFAVILLWSAVIRKENDIRYRNDRGSADAGFSCKKSGKLG